MVLKNNFQNLYSVIRNKFDNSYYKYRLLLNIFSRFHKAFNIKTFYVKNTVNQKASSLNNIPAKK